MRVFITGGTGLIGRRLTQKLVERGDTPVILSRRADEFRRDPANRKLTVVQGDPAVAGHWEDVLDGSDAVVNLVGHNIFAERWNKLVRQKIRDSRVDGTERVVAAIAKAAVKPKVLVQGSAIGYYGPTQDEDLTEASPPGSDFMASVCRQWEEAALPAETQGTRVVYLRTGVVLAKGEGALGVMTPIFKMGPGTPVGNGGSLLKPADGRQWMSWIHLDDIVGLILHSIDHAAVTGPLNGTAPNPVRNSEFSKALSNTLRTPTTPWRRYVPLGPPDIMLEMMLGDVAQVVTKGQKVLPTKALETGYKFLFPELAGALTSIFAKAPKAAPVAAASHH